MARSKNFDQNQVLHAAMHLFWSRGYQAASANDLVEELQLSRSSLYATFGDKHSLYIRVLQLYRETIVAGMLGLIAESTDIRSTLRQIFNMIVEQDIDSSSPKGCLMVNAAIELAQTDAEIRELVITNQQKIEGALEAALELGRERGELELRMPTADLAKFLYNSISGIRVELRTNRSRASLNRLIDVTLAMLG